MIAVLPSDDKRIADAAAAMKWTPGHLVEMAVDCLIDRLRAGQGGLQAIREMGLPDPVEPPDPDAEAVGRALRVSKPWGIPL